jgi:spoIIIJ-associated protein
MDQQQSIQHAKQYLENILSFFGVNVDVEVSVRDEFLEMSVPSTEENSILIGRNADTLRSIQYLVSTMLRNSDAAITRVNIDIADYKKQRAHKLEQQAREWVAEIRQSGNTKVLHLNAADRRIVHGVVAEYSDIISASEGEGRDRKLIISQASS